MAEFVNSQLTPLLLILDSSQAEYRSEDGSTATFDLTGADTEMSHVEARTAVVSLHEFRCVHNFYNIDNTCDILEIFVQYTDAYGILQQGNSTLVQIPFGNYNAAELVSTLNDCFLRQCPPKQVGINTVYTCFGSSTQEGFVEDFQYTLDGEKIQQTGKFKFVTPPLSALAVNVDLSYKYYYQGFYVITDNYPTLPRLLGLPPEKGYPLPTVSPKNGFGITLVKTPTSPITSAPVVVDGPNVGLPIFMPPPPLNRMNYAVLPKDVLYYTQPISMVRQDAVNFSPNTVGTLQCLSLPALDYPRDIYVCAESVRTRNVCSNKVVPRSNILAKVPFDCFFGDTFSYEPANPPECYVPSLKLDTMTIRLYDEEGNALLWNGGHWTVVLCIRYSVDSGSAGFENASLGRTYRPYLSMDTHDPLTTEKEHYKKLRR